MSFTKPPLPKSVPSSSAPKPKPQQTDLVGPVLADVASGLDRVGKMKRWKAWLLAVLILLVGLVVLANLVYEPGTIAHARDQAGALIAACGKPSADDSTAYDNPRPPIPTRIVDYWGTHIRFLFVPKGKFGQPPPYDWHLVTIADAPDWTDTENPKPITHEEVHRRMPCMRFPS